MLEDSPRAAAWLVLQSIPGLGPKWITAIHRINRAHERTMRDFLALAPRVRATEYAALPTLILDAVRQAEALLPEAMAQLAELGSEGVRCITLEGHEHAALLGRLAPQERPPILYLRGDERLLRGPAIAIIGSREAPQATLDLVRETAFALARSGIAIISGGACGTDRAAHKGALEAGGKTVCVPSRTIVGFRWPKELRVPLNCGHALVMSAAPPQRRRWSLGWTMERNRLIVRLAGVILAAPRANRGGTVVGLSKALRAGQPSYVVGDDVWVAHWLKMGARCYAGGTAQIKHLIALVHDLHRRDR